MAPKKKGGGKKKAPALDVREEALAAFGLKPEELIRTPLGLLVTVLGVKYEAPASKEGGSVWVRYSNGHEAPLQLEGRPGSSAAALGYRCCSEAETVRRDVAVTEAELQRLEGKRRVVVEVMQLKAAGLPIPDHLRPAPKEEKKGKGDKAKGAEAGNKIKAKKS